MTLKVRILPFLTTFAQLSARLKNFLRGWLLVLGIKEGLVEFATVCVKSVFILKYSPLETQQLMLPYLANVTVVKFCINFNFSSWLSELGKRYRYFILL